MALFTGLETNTHLHHLGIAGNEIGQYAAPIPNIVEALCESLRLNSRLLSLDLRENSIAVAFRKEIGQAIGFLCSDQTGLITGVTLPVDGGLHLT